MKTLIYLGMMCGAIACVAQDPLPPEGPAGEAADKEANQAISATGAQTDGLPAKVFRAEDLASRKLDSTDAISLAQDCVFIQWCDEPPAGGDWKVVGKVRPGCFDQCFNDDIVNEFFRDARAVCGRTSLDDNKWRIDCF